jgi:lysophospholipase L1-like esterase
MDDSNPDAITTTNFEHERGHRRFTVRDTAVCLLVVFAGLLVCYGGAPLHAAEQIPPGQTRDVAVAVSRPGAWIARTLPFASVAHKATAWLSPDDTATASGPAAGVAVARGGVPAVSADAFSPGDLGPRPARRPLHTLLVTGDSMSQPLDVQIARRLAPHGVRIIRDAHLGTGISKNLLVDWTKLAGQQVRADRPDAVVMFIGANEGFPLKGPDGRSVSCCGPQWAAAYANRARVMLAAYRQGGRGRVYWLTLPTPRDPARAKIAHAVNAAVRVAVEPYLAQARILDMNGLFTPGERYRPAMPVNGTDTIVREPDGIHLNEAGASLAAQHVIAAVMADFVD